MEEPPGRGQRENRGHRQGEQSFSAAVCLVAGAGRGGPGGRFQKSRGNLFCAGDLPHRNPALRGAAGVGFGAWHDDSRAIRAVVPHAHDHDRHAWKRRVAAMITFSFQLLFWLALCLAPLAVGVWLVYFLLSLPLRRQERARFFLDLLELGRREGRAPEQTIVAVSQSRDESLGVRFHLLAAHLESGLRLGQALDKVPRLLPPQLSAMLKSGEEIGDALEVLPACRQLRKDGFSQTRGALNYVILIFLALTPAAPVIFQALSIFVFPKLLMILREMEIAPPAFTATVVHQTSLLASIMTATAAM